MSGGWNQRLPQGLDLVVGSGRCNRRLWWWPVHAFRNRGQRSRPDLFRRPHPAGLAEGVCGPDRPSRDHCSPDQFARLARTYCNSLGFELDNAQVWACEERDAGATAHVFLTGQRLEESPVQGRHHATADGRRLGCRPAVQLRADHGAVRGMWKKCSGAVQSITAYCHGDHECSRRSPPASPFLGRLAELSWWYSLRDPL